MVTVTLNEGQGQLFSQIWKSFTKGSFLVSLVKIGQAVSDKKSFKGFSIYGHCDLEGRSRSIILNNLKGLNLRIIPAKLGYIWSSSFREEVV